MEVPLKSTVRRHRGRPKDQSISSRRRRRSWKSPCASSPATVIGKPICRSLKMPNVGKGTIYRYFPSKEVLFLAAVDMPCTG